MCHISHGSHHHIKVRLEKSTCPSLLNAATFVSCCCQGYLCLPYMALQQHHLLSDVTVRGFVAGATNILFRQQRHLSDAIVEVICVYFYSYVQEVS